MKFILHILLLFCLLPLFKAQCDSNPIYCQNQGICGVNGNCVCQSFYYGDRCESKVPKSEQAVLRSDGIKSGMLFLYCFLIMVLLPFCLYLMIVLCIRVCSEEKDKLTLRESLADAFCCKREQIFCCKCEKEDKEEIQEKKENKEKEQQWPEYIAQNFDQQEKDKGKLPENNQTIKEHSSNVGDDKQQEFGPKDQSNQELKEINLPEINKKKGILQPPLDSIEEIVQPQNEDSMKKEEQGQLQSKEDRKQTDHKSEEENEKSGPKSSSKENGFLNMNKKLHDSQPIIEEDMNEDGEYYDEDGQDQIAKVIDTNIIINNCQFYSRQITTTKKSFDLKL